jgi:hypothetical protein
MNAPAAKGRRLARLMLASLLVAACVAVPARAAAPPGFFGTVSITPLTTADYARMQNVGSTTLRFLVPWSSIQPQAGDEYHWGSLDAAVTEAANHGIQLLPILISTPKHIASCGSRDCRIRIPVYTKEQRGAWHDFLTAAVQRYGPGGTFWTDPLHPERLLILDPITHWQIWNEENNTNVHAKPRDYAKLIKISHNAIKAVDPDGAVVLGGLAGNVSGGHPHPTAQDYLDDIYKFAPKSSFDDVALHPYADQVKDVSREIKAVRRVMLRHHDGSKGLMITEIGWGSGAPKEQHEFVLTPKGQKQRLLQSFKLLLAHRSQWHLAGVYWFDWRDPAPGTGLCGFCYSSGLLKHSGHEKPAFEAFKRFTGS